MCLAGWKGRLLSMARRRVLVRSVLTAMPTFTMTALKVPKKLLKEIDKARRKFLWAQDDEIFGRKCKVGWGKVCSSVESGGGWGCSICTNSVKHCVSGGFGWRGNDPRDRGVCSLLPTMTQTRPSSCLPQRSPLATGAPRGSCRSPKRGSCRSNQMDADSSGIYSASSAYTMQLTPDPASGYKSLIWKTWAPGKLKFFFWLLMLNRHWCND